MLKSRMLAGGILLLALSAAVPAGMVLKSAESASERTLRAAQNTSETVEAKIDSVEYAMELSSHVTHTVGSQLDHANSVSAVALPKSTEKVADPASDSIEFSDPAIQRSLKEAQAQKEAEEKLLLEETTDGYADGFSFDISQTIFPVTSEEVEMLKYVVEAEAGGGSLEDKRLVTFSITNRVLSKKFPSTLYKVLHAKNQFSTIENYYSKAKKPSESTCRAVEEVLMGACTDNSQNCLYFYCTDYPVKQSIVDWFENDLQYLYTVGCDRFFTDPS